MTEAEEVEAGVEDGVDGVDEAEEGVEAEGEIENKSSLRACVHDD